MYIHTPTNTYPYSVSQLKRDNPQTSFPKEMTDAVLASWGVYPVQPTPCPEADPITQRVVELPPMEVDGQWFQQWEVQALLPDEVVVNQAAAAQAARAQAKAERAAAVAAIKVTTSTGNTFDGDETSQTRMIRAIMGMQAAGAPSINWILADNKVIQATSAELAEALSLAGAAQAAMWVIA